MDLCLGEISDHSDEEENLTMTFYFKEKRVSSPVRPPSGSVLVFGMLLHPVEGTVEYVGSVFASGRLRLHALCYNDLCDLDDRLENTPCTFFVKQTAKQLAQILVFQQTVGKVSERRRMDGCLSVSVAQIGLTSGSVIVIRPTAPNETVNAAAVQQELRDIDRSHSRLSGTVTTRSMTPSEAGYMNADGDSTSHISL